VCGSLLQSLHHHHLVYDHDHDGPHPAKCVVLYYKAYIIIISFTIMTTTAPIQLRVWFFTTNDVGFVIKNHTLSWMGAIVVMIVNEMMMM
jgi:hypothetical protein